MEIINNIQKAILETFDKVSDSEYFYLTGGTALSLFHLKHRKSNDLDFFTSNEEIVLPFSYRLEEIIRSKGMIVQRQRGLHSFVELFVQKNDNTTIVHLACDSPFHLGKAEVFSDYPGLNVDSLQDLAANKLLALFGRATLRDFIDVFILVKKAGFSTSELMDKAKIKDPGFDPYWLGIALERINLFNKDSSEMFLLIEHIDFESLAYFFNQWREEISKSLQF